MDKQTLHPTNLDRDQPTPTQLPLFQPGVPPEMPMGYPPLVFQEQPPRNWKDSRQVMEVYRLCRPMLEDYIADRRSSLTQEMVTAAIAGAHTKATVAAAQLNMLDSLLESLEMYMTQELAIRSASAFI